MCVNFNHATFVALFCISKINVIAIILENNTTRISRLIYRGVHCSVELIFVLILVKQQIKHIKTIKAFMIISLIILLMLTKETSIAEIVAHRVKINIYVDKIESVLDCFNESFTKTIVKTGRTNDARSIIGILLIQKIAQDNIK